MFSYARKIIGKVGSTTKLGSNKLRISVSLFLSCVQTAADIIGPFIFVAAVDDLTKSNNPLDSIGHPGLLKMLLYTSMYTTSQMITYLRESILYPVGADLSYQLTTEVMQHSYDSPMAFRVSNTNAPAVQHFGSAYEHIGQAFITNLFGSSISHFINYSATTAFIGYKYRDAAIPLGISIGLHGIGAYFCAKFVGTRQNRYVNTLFEGYETIIGKLDNYENAHFYSNVPEEMRRLNVNLKNLNRDFVSSLGARSNSAIFLNLLSGLGASSFLFYASWLFQKGKLDSNDLVVLAFYALQVASSMRGFSESLNKLSGNYENFRSLLDYLATPTVSGGRELKIHNQEQATIEFKNVSFSYEEKSIFQHLSFTVKPGQVVAIVGKSGAGKSTILRLLFQFYKPTDGVIRVGGVNIQDLDSASLRRAFAIVPQSPNIFSDTLFENIKYGNLTASRTDVTEAGINAGLSDIMAERLDSKAGNAGGKFSGGQKQRIAIARAYLRKDAHFLALDEPTSALDEKTEEAVLKSFNDLIETHKKPTIIITHSLERLERYIKISQIINLDDLANRVNTSPSIVRSNSSSLLSKMASHHATIFRLPTSPKKETKSAKQDSDNLLNTPLLRDRASALPTTSLKSDSPTFS